MSDLEVYAGNDKTLDFVVTDNATGALVDLTGVDLRFTVKVAKTDADDVAVLNKVVVPAVDQTGDRGEASVELSSTDTEDLEGVYGWDLQLKDAADNIETVDEGRIRFKRRVRVDLTHA